MEYNQMLEYIKRNFQEKIQTQDKMLQIKIFNNLFNWYKNNFEKDLQQALKENNQLKIIYILEQIEKVCRLNDYEKMKMVYMDENLEKLKIVSYKIFYGVKEFIKNDKKVYNSEVLNEFLKEINELGENINKIHKNEFDIEKSECLLDIEFLKNEGKVKNYSIRTYKLIKN